MAHSWARLKQFFRPDVALCLAESSLHISGPSVPSRQEWVSRFHSDKICLEEQYELHYLLGSRTLHSLDSASETNRNLLRIFKRFELKEIKNLLMFAMSATDYRPGLQPLIIAVKHPASPCVLSWYVWRRIEVHNFGCICLASRIIPLPWRIFNRWCMLVDETVNVHCTCTVDLTLSTPGVLEPECCAIVEVLHSAECDSTILAMISTVRLIHLILWCILGVSL